MAISDDASAWRRSLSMAAFVVAASSIYDLPYFLLGVFRPVALEAFGLSNTRAGIIMAVYGIVNMLLYLPGGTIADGFSPGLLMFVGLTLTGLGGFYMATFPSFVGLCFLLFAWSLSSIFIYWAAFVKAVRDWGAPGEQGWTWALFGAVQGMIGAIKLALMVEYFSSLLPQGAENATLAEKKSAIQAVIWIYSVCTCLAAILVLFGLPLHRDVSVDGRPVSPRLLTVAATGGLKACANMKVALIASILLSAYFCSHILNYFPQYAINGYHTTAVDAARIVTIGAWTKPMVCLAVGWFADRVRCSVVCAVCLCSFVVLFSIMGSMTPKPGNTGELATYVVLTNVTSASIASVFWALLQEANIPIKVTGAVVGFVSFVGYSPDAFSPPLVGYIMDTKPGLEGNQYSMLIGAGFALLGLCANLWLVQLLRTGPDANVVLDGEDEQLLAKKI